MRELDDWLAHGRPTANVERIARWWTSATEEAKYALLERATKENTPPLDQVRLAILLSETAQGKVEEG